MKIGLISDIHATPAPVREALTLFAELDADMVWCAGDIAGYGTELAATIDLLAGHDCISVCGNHDSWYLDDNGVTDTAAVFLKSLPYTLQMNIEGYEVLMVHGSPLEPLHGGIRLRDENGVFSPEACADWSQKLLDCTADVLVVGHTHQVFVRELGGTLVVNPGSTCFNHTCMLITFPDLQVEMFSLAGQAPLLSWNFGFERGRAGGK